MGGIDAGGNRRADDGGGPFEVEITIPDISGAIFSGDPDVPNTLFTVPYVVVRATGDTANAIYEAPLNSTYASKVIAEIPGIGRAEVFGGGGSVSVRTGDVNIASPEFPTVFDMGIRAMFDTVPGYDMQTSLGPIALHDAFTYHWGATSSMIPFTLDNGKVGTFRGGAKEGATLRSRSAEMRRIRLPRGSIVTSARSCKRPDRTASRHSRKARVAHRVASRSRETCCR